MSEQTIVVIIFGSLVVAFGAFASYMADRQQDEEKREKQNHAH